MCWPLVRLYVEMEKLKSDERVSSRNITAEKLIESAKRIFHPYRFDVKEVAWWSVYEIGQRLSDKFDDVPEGEVGQKPELLHTYTEERQKVAQTLIDFDKEWSSIMASRAQASVDGKEAISAEKFQEYFVKSGRYTAGTAIQYQPSMISGALTHQHLATGFEIGTRFQFLRFHLIKARSLHQLRFVDFVFI